MFKSILIILKIFTKLHNKHNLLLFRSCIQQQSSTKFQPAPIVKILLKILLSLNPNNNLRAKPLTIQRIFHKIILRVHPTTNKIEQKHENKIIQ